MERYRTSAPDAADVQQTGQASVLVVDDDEGSRKLLEALLRAEGHSVRGVVDGEDALAAVDEHLPSLIVLDIMMPGIDGFEVMRRLKADARTETIPIILLTALEDRESRIKALDGGGVEFLTKPVERAELVIRVRNLLKMKAYEDSLVVSNTSMNHHIQWLAHFDPLTGLPNRALLADRINVAVSLARREEEPLAVLFLDLDNFKQVNDTLGHQVGDELLKAVAQCMRSVLRDQDTISRQGGDEFVVLLPNADANGAARVAGKLLQVIAQGFLIAEHDLVVTSSIGVAMFPNDGEDFESLCKCADVAMYRAKRDGRNTFRFFTQEMQLHAVRTLQLQNAMRHALKADQMYLHYQPQVSLEDQRIIGAEALLRWQHPEFGAVSPVEFIPIAESSGQILPIGEWVLRTAVHQSRTWMDRGIAPLITSVNLSAVQFRHPRLPELVTQILAEAKLPPQHLLLELTESAAMDDPLIAIRVMNDLRERGIRMSIDDFGTGHSSLTYLKRFQAYQIKIDRSFVSNIAEAPHDRAIIVTIINMARSLGMRTIAEGVETEEQLAFLRENGCDEIQGYYVSKPLPTEAFEVLVREDPPRQWTRPASIH